MVGSDIVGGGHGACATTMGSCCRGVGDDAACRSVGQAIVVARRVMLFSLVNAAESRPQR